MPLNEKFHLSFLQKYCFLIFFFKEKFIETGTDTRKLSVPQTLQIYFFSYYFKFLRMSQLKLAPCLTLPCLSPLHQSSRELQATNPKSQCRDV